VNRNIYRIIDANLNRSREGLRVCEEITRFVLNSSTMTRQLKSVRHSITRASIKYLPKRPRAIFSRDTNNDVGRVSRNRSEMKRSGARDIFSANMQRAKESLRVLEEFFKLVDKSASMRFSALRFRVYRIEKTAAKRIGQ
jgi:thiamine-phosphate pyrophosphorylase